MFGTDIFFFPQYFQSVVFWIHGCSTVDNMEVRLYVYMYIYIHIYVCVFTGRGCEAKAVYPVRKIYYKGQCFLPSFPQINFKDDTTLLSLRLWDIFSLSSPLSLPLLLSLLPSSSFSLSSPPPIFGL